ncbi:hypothetical protein OHC33_004529 [Knufia fluminis]|uniref:Uncharacterized protein n=1 Tax=Knufia fluminis TaxID=191047 RepID=A0AAN8EMM6_9EURO|nr:hypothetical protein OHC33_004529 [Knufia fluminis]
MEERRPSDTYSSDSPRVKRRPVPIQAPERLHGTVDEQDPSLLRRIGYWSMFVLVAGIIVELAGVAFLVFLWTNPTGYTTYRKIILANWLTRSITLSALAIRWAVSAQAATAASMLAAIVLHKSRVPLPDAAAISLIRFAASGIHNLLLPLLGTLKLRVGCLIWCLALVMTTTTLLLQFTSTVLLSDVQLDMIQGNPTETTINAMWSDSFGAVEDLGFGYTQTESDLLTRAPTMYPTFAELRNPAYFDNYIYDTNTSYRGLLPIPDAQTRSMIRRYEGPAAVIDTRTICIKPESINIDISLFLDVALNDFQDGNNVYVRGQIGFTQDMEPNEYLEDPRMSIPFNCTAPLPVASTIQSGKLDSTTSYSAEPEWPVAICPVPVIDPIKLPIDIWQGLQGTWSAYLVLNTTGSLASWYAATNGSNTSWQTVQTSGQDDGEWAIWAGPYGPPAALALSMCFYSHASKDLRISASSDTNHTEATIFWDPKTAWFDTTNIRHSYGLTSTTSSTENTSPAQYGQLTMTPLTPEDLSFNYTFDYKSNSDLFWNRIPGQFPTNISTFLCRKCYNLDSRGNNHMQTMTATTTAIVNDVLRTTRRPALAVQTLFTLLSTMPYYDQLMALDGPLDATYVLFEERLMARSWMGLMAVLIVLAVHLLLFALVLVLFFLGTARSTAGFIGNAWVVVAQVAVHERVRGWIGRATGLDDGAVERYLEGGGRAKEMVQL